MYNGNIQYSAIRDSTSRFCNLIFFPIKKEYCCQHEGFLKGLLLSNVKSFGVTCAMFKKNIFFLSFSLFVRVCACVCVSYEIVTIKYILMTILFDVTCFCFVCTRRIYTCKKYNTSCILHSMCGAYRCLYRFFSRC